MSTLSDLNLPSTDWMRSKISSAEPYFSKRSICLSSPLSKDCTPTLKRSTLSASGSMISGMRWLGLVSEETSRMSKSSLPRSIVETSSSIMIVGVPPPTYMDVHGKPSSATTRISSRSLRKYAVARPSSNGKRLKEQYGHSRSQKGTCT